MNDTQIKTFLTLAEILNFTEASYKLYTTQSAVSRTISSMEQELGYPLFIRFHQDTRLTAAGIVLYNGLKILYQEYCDLTREAERTIMKATGTLAIGFLEGQLMDPVSQDLLVRMQHDLPEIRNHIVRSSPGALTDQLMQGQLDVAFTLESAVKGIPQLKYVPVIPLKTYLMFSMNSPLHMLKQLKLSDLQGQRFISTRSSDIPQMTGRLQAVCRAAGFEPEITEVETLSDALLWVETGRGVGIFHEYYSACYSPLLDKHQFPELLQEHLVLVWNPKNSNLLIPDLVNRIPGT